jgi:hypothetical protein
MLLRAFASDNKDSISSPPIDFDRPLYALKAFTNLIGYVVLLLEMYRVRHTDQLLGWQLNRNELLRSGR